MSHNNTWSLGVKCALLLMVGSDSLSFYER